MCPICDQQGQVLFVEAEAWEHADLVNKCSRGCGVHVRYQKLQDLPDGDLPSDVTVLSPFIHSRCDGEQLQRFPKLELVVTRSTGHDHIDLDYCNEHGITVCNVPRYGENTVAEHTFALLLALTRKITLSHERTIRGDFSIEGLRGIDLHDKTLGCLGTGDIGLRVLRIAAGFGMKLLAYDLRPNEQAAKEIGFDYVQLDTLLKRSNVLSIHVPYNKHTHHMVDAAAMERLPRGAIVLNTARGGIIDPQALIQALQSGHLGGAGLDVLEAETAVAEEAEILSSEYNVETLRSIVRNHALLRMPNVIITPHVAFNSTEAVQRLIDTTISNIAAYYAGQPENVVGQK
jgi:D-lactate dehydrogenase